MYFNHFDSFQQAQSNTKSFKVSVERVNNTTVTSSPIPIESLAEVMSEIADAEQGGPIHLWSGLNKSLVIVPSSMILSVTITFG